MSGRPPTTARTSMQVLLAFDKFKEAITAHAACAAAAEALHSIRPDWTLDLCPLADGGDGFSTILTNAAKGRFVPVDTTDARGRPLRATYGLVSTGRVPPAVRALMPGLPEGVGDIALVETAAASGLAAIPVHERDPLRATTRGTGELLAHAANSGASAIILGLGGSATHDLGLGALAALGLAAVDAAGEIIAWPSPDNWPRIAGWKHSPPRPLPPLYLACDVDNPLCGPRGAAACFASQKGLPSTDVSRLDVASGKIARQLCTTCGRTEELLTAPGSGAAGGLGFGLACATGARFVSGADLVSAWLNLEQRIRAADLILTGEGAFDATSLTGKGPGLVVAFALAAGRRAEVFAGRIAAECVDAPNLRLHAITPPGIQRSAALAHTAVNLKAAIARAF
ncbi:MAG: hypothetical protein RIQ79_1192 [Verrucomicrobiota bacterium]